MTEPQPQTSKAKTAFTKDERGILNNWAIEPKMYVEDEDRRFGWTEYAELANGRLAMIGFVSLLILELATHKGLIAIIGGL
ncbi:MAG: chlorophyll A-B-binding protein [Oscillatoriales cyanobacterium SM2_2_1]|nr:chlorophyll A-B-binding protein [Oscillatoriales cyanobacterium SM2_2_1]